MPRIKKQEPINPESEYSLGALVNMRVLPNIGRSHAAYRLEFARQKQLGNTLTYQSLGSGTRTVYVFLGKDVLEFIDKLAK